ncbi:hypothetical protein GWI33_001405 [Rhynchophorus ferrugineus]|uniref:Uncharacterized protein n=1 Tax=Rhynchophorus ferrugineus TaxID=354439 RepID=A0A834IUQ8_RHYFE|nr:hypothetical protein GWI33_001405 [Rhynchophorus ferrugineus]
MIPKYRALIILFCLLALFPHNTLQQRKNMHRKYQESKDNGINQEPIRKGIEWRTVALITSSVLILGLIFYGKKFYYICQMTICGGVEKHYMDLATHV